MAIRDESDDHGAPLRPGVVTALLVQLAHRDTAAAPPLLAPGTRAGRYEIIRSIGHGGFGSVYEAHDGALHRLVALKVLHRSQAVDPGEAIEGEAAARLAHPNIAVVHDAGILDGGAPYLVYELLHGETLESRLTRGPMLPREALASAVQVGRALAHAHAAGIVHRDLKPSNVFLTAEGDVKVLDFGVALLFGRQGPSGGTPAYMAPEQRRGEPEDARTDLYALGLLLREMLVGPRAAVPGASASHVPHPVQRILASLLAEEPSARPRSSRAAVAALESAARSLTQPRERRRRLAVASLAVLALAVMVGAGVLVRGRFPRRGAVTDTAAPSIAVLPFVDMSPQQDQEYFSDGIAEEILNALSRVEGLHVAGRTSSFSFKGKADDLRTVANKLNVRAVLEGSVRKAGSRVRVTAQLVDAANGFRLWSETYDRELSDVFAVQDEIARSVVAALALKLVPGSAPSTRAYRTPDPEVHTQYLLGRHFWSVMADRGRAVQAFEKALAREPTYAPAWAGLAVAVFDVGDRAQTAAALEEGCRRGLEAAEKAIALDPTLSEGFSTRGLLREACRRDWEGAKEDMQRSLALSPGDPYARRRWGVLQLALGHVAEATAALQSSISADPLAPLTWRWLGTAKLAAWDPTSAREALNRSLELRPDDPYAMYLVGVSWLLQGDPAAAQAAIERVPAGDTDALVIRALAAHARGHRQEARRAVQELEAKAAQGDTYASLDLARVHAWSGERVRALEWLERAVSMNVGDLWFVPTDPLLRAVRQDARYLGLLRRMNLPASDLPE